MQIRLLQCIRLHDANNSAFDRQQANKGARSPLFQPTKNCRAGFPINSI